MAITRTAMIDDDGSGTTGTILNNAWKQELYNQIDAQVSTGTWTPVDGSGAGLALIVTAARYWKYEKCVVIEAYVSYPATANTATAVIGGLPFPNGSCQSALTCGTSNATVYQIAASQSVVWPIVGSSGLQRKNNELSGAGIVFAGVYLTA